MVKEKPGIVKENDVLKKIMFKYSRYPLRYCLYEPRQDFQGWTLEETYKPRIIQGLDLII